MDYCCQRFEESVQTGNVVRAEAGDETAWFIPRLGHLHYCPFCGADIKYFIAAVENEPDMSTLDGLLKRIGEAAYFSGIEVAGPNTLGLFGATPLHIAATWGDCESIQMLVAAGADINAQGEYDFTPLMEAVSQGNMEAVRLLVELGAKPITNEDGNLPSEFAAMINNAELEVFLKDEGY